MSAAGTDAPLPIEFNLHGAHLGDLLLALPAIGAALKQAPVIVSGLLPRHFTALRDLPVAFRHAPGVPVRTLRPRFQPGTHRTVAWLDALGPGTQPVRVPIPIHGLGQAKALLPPARWALLSTWADHPAKRWPMANWSLVAQSLLDRGYRVALIGPAQAREHDPQPWPPGVHDLRGQDTPTTWPALLTRASLVVSLDTGSVHMADALGIPVVGLYSVAHPHEYGPFWQQHACVHAAHMASISPEDVLARIESYSAP